MLRDTGGFRMDRNGGGSSLGGREEEFNLFCEMQPNAISPPVSRVTAMASVDAEAEEDLLTADLGKNDYDWLLTPPDTPIFNGVRQASGTLPMESAPFSQNDLPNLMRSLAAIKTSRASGAMSRRLDATSKVQGTNLFTANGTLNKRSSLAPKSMPTSRSTTPTSRATISSPFNTMKASTLPTSTPRSISTSRPSTPSRRPSTPVSSQTESQSLDNASRRSSISRANSITSINATMSRGSSPAIKARAVPTPIVPGFSLEPPPNLRTVGPIHSSLSSRGRPVTPTSKGTASIPTTPLRGASRAAATVENAPGRIRRPSSPGFARGMSPTKDRLASNSASMLSNGKDEVIHSQPLARGSKTGEKMVLSRRNSTPLASSSSYFYGQSPISNHSASRPTTPLNKDTRMYGRDQQKASKKSLDMTLKQLDMDQSPSNGLRSIISNTNTSSLYSVKSMNRHNILSQSSATRDCNNALDVLGRMHDFEGSEVSEDIIIDMKSTSSSFGNSDMSYTFPKDVSINSQIDIPKYRDNGAEPLELAYHAVEKPVVSKPPAMCLHGGKANCELCSLKQRLSNLHQACKNRSILGSIKG